MLSVSRWTVGSSRSSRSGWRSSSAHGATRHCSTPDSKLTSLPPGGQRNVRSRLRHSPVPRLSVQRTTQRERPSSSGHGPTQNLPRQAISPPDSARLYGVRNSDRWTGAFRPWCIRHPCKTLPRLRSVRLRGCSLRFGSRAPFSEGEQWNLRGPAIVVALGFTGVVGLMFWRE